MSVDVLKNFEIRVVPLALAGSRLPVIFHLLNLDFLNHHITVKSTRTLDSCACADSSAVPSKEQIELPLDAAEIISWSIELGSCLRICTRSIRSGVWNRLDDCSRRSDRGSSLVCPFWGRRVESSCDHTVAANQKNLPSKATWFQASRGSNLSRPLLNNRIFLTGLHSIFYSPFPACSAFSFSNLFNSLIFLLSSFLFLTSNS
ncbi:hypothetical protein KCU62_g18, partial [Aureobasidium sp. EXF-3399]